jgi:hypothetical protein
MAKVQGDNRQSARDAARPERRVALALIAFFAAFGAAGFVAHRTAAIAAPDAAASGANSDTAASAAAASVLTPQQQRRRQPAARRTATPRPTPRPYRFSHGTKEHRKACDTCHKFPSANWEEARKGGEPFPDVTQYPDHPSCLNCHRRQFFAGERPQPRICTVCHETAQPRKIVLHPFPALRERFDQTAKGRAATASDFLIFYPHDKHNDLITAGLRRPADPRAEFLNASSPGARAWPRRQAQQQQPAAADNCAVCHQTHQPQGDAADEYVTPPPKDLGETDFWLKKGTFKTSPAGHAKCFSCHMAESGILPEPKDCAACHKLPAAPLPEGDFDPALAARMGITDRVTLMKWRRREAGRYRHEWFSHAELACTACHNVMQMNTADERAKKVPVRSCAGAPGAGCHAEPPDGVLIAAVAAKKADPNFTCTKCHVTFGRKALPASHAEFAPQPAAK